MVTVRIPTPLRTQTGGRAELTAAAGTVGGVLDEVVARHPGLGERLRAPDGRLHRFVNVFVEDEDVRDRRGLDTPVADGEVVTIVPAVAGGAVGPEGPPRDGRDDRRVARGWVAARPALVRPRPNDGVRRR